MDEMKRKGAAKKLAKSVHFYAKFIAEVPGISSSSSSSKGNKNTA